MPRKNGSGAGEAWKVGTVPTPEQLLERLIRDVDDRGYFRHFGKTFRIKDVERIPQGTQLWLMANPDEDGWGRDLFVGAVRPDGQPLSQEWRVVPADASRYTPPSKRGGTPSRWVNPVAIAAVEAAVKQRAAAAAQPSSAKGGKVQSPKTDERNAAAVSSRSGAAAAEAAPPMKAEPQEEAVTEAAPVQTSSASSAQATSARKTMRSARGTRARQAEAAAKIHAASDQEAKASGPHIEAADLTNSPEARSDGGAGESVPAATTLPAAEAAVEQKSAVAEHDVADEVRREAAEAAAKTLAEAAQKAEEAARRAAEEAVARKVQEAAQEAQEAARRTAEEAALQKAREAEQKAEETARRIAAEAAEQARQAAQKAEETARKAAEEAAAEKAKEAALKAEEAARRIAAEAAAQTLKEAAQQAEEAARRAAEEAAASKVAEAARQAEEAARKIAEETAARTAKQTEKLVEQAARLAVESVVRTLAAVAARKASAQSAPTDQPEGFTQLGHAGLSEVPAGDSSGHAAVSHENAAAEIGRDLARGLRNIWKQAAKRMSSQAVQYQESYQRLLAQDPEAAKRHLLLANTQRILLRQVHDLAAASAAAVSQNADPVPLLSELSELVAENGAAFKGMAAQKRLDAVIDGKAADAELDRAILADFEQWARWLSAELQRLGAEPSSASAPSEDRPAPKTPAARTVPLRSEKASLAARRAEPENHAELAEREAAAASMPPAALQPDDPQAGQKPGGPSATAEAGTDWTPHDIPAITSSTYGLIMFSLYTRAASDEEAVSRVKRFLQEIGFRRSAPPGIPVGYFGYRITAASGDELDDMPGMRRVEVRWIFPVPDDRPAQHAEEINRKFEESRIYRRLVSSPEFVLGGTWVVTTGKYRKSEAAKVPVHAADSSGVSHAKTLEPVSSGPDNGNQGHDRKVMRGGPNPRNRRFHGNRPPQANVRLLRETRDPRFRWRGDEDFVKVERDGTFMFDGILYQITPPSAFRRGYRYLPLMFADDAETVLVLAEFASGQRLPLGQVRARKLWNDEQEVPLLQRIYRALTGRKEGDAEKRRSAREPAKGSLRDVAQSLTNAFKMIMNAPRSFIPIASGLRYREMQELVARLQEVRIQTVWERDYNNRYTVKVVDPQTEWAARYLAEDPKRRLVRVQGRGLRTFVKDQQVKKLKQHGFQVLALPILEGSERGKWALYCRDKDRKAIRQVLNIRDDD